MHDSCATTRDFSGLWIPLITPFANGQVDHPNLTKLIRHYAGKGIAGFVACGSTGEAAALSASEQLAVLNTILNCAGDHPVVMGMSGYNLPEALNWLHTLKTYPVAGVLIPAPHYIRPPQSGMQQWFSALADAASAPVVIYDIPYRTGVAIELDTLLGLAEHPNIAAIKDCGGDAAKTQALIADGRLQVLAGDDAQIFTTVAQGGAGAIAASAHLRTVEFVQVIRHLRDDQLLAAQKIWHSLMPHVSAMFAQPNPIAIKAALAKDGWIHNGLRPPMGRE